MPIQINPASQQYTLLEGVTGAGVTSNSIFRGWYTQHMIQVSTSGSTAQTFTVYTSADGDIWTAIRDHTDVDSTVVGYTGANATGVINLSGSYPWFKIATVGVSNNPFTAVIYSTNRTTT
jgi:hypothetical protein